MQQATTVSKSISKQNPNLQFALDSTTLGSFKTCMWYGYLRHILNLVPLREPAPLTFGRHLHTGFEHYHRHLAEGMNTDEALAKAHLKMWKDACVETKDNQPCEICEGCLADELCSAPEQVEKVSLWHSGRNERTMLTLSRALILYADTYDPDPAETLILADGRPAVELSFDFSPGYEFHTGDKLHLCGHIDRLVTFKDRLWVTDYKTSGYPLDKKFFNKFNPHNQMTLYTIASQIHFEQPTEGIIIDGIQLLVGSTRFARGLSYRTAMQLEDWLTDLYLFLDYYDLCAERGAFPKCDMESVCNAFFKPCIFKEACTAAPEMEKAILRSQFKTEVWDPLTPR